MLTKSQKAAIVFEDDITPEAEISEVVDPKPSAAVKPSVRSKRGPKVTLTFPQGKLL